MIDQNSTWAPSYRFGSKKASKFEILLMQSIFLKSMNRGLSKTGLRISSRRLVMILCRFEVWSKLLKNRGDREESSHFQILHFEYRIYYKKEKTDRFVFEIGEILKKNFL